MFRYLVRRLLWALVLFIAVTMVSYIIFFLVPAEPARLVAGPQAPPDAVERARKFLHLDDPIWKQYLRFLHALSPITLDGARPEAKTPSLGRSFATRQEVNKIVKAAAPVTISLVIGGAILWMLIALPIGILSALRPRSLLDRGAMIFVLIGISAHPVWLGLLLSYFIGYRLGLTPLGGYCDLVNPSTACGGPVQWAHAMILPWITFAILFAALYVRMIRANVMEAMNEDYVRTARAKGAPEHDRDALARAPERDAPRRDDARAWTSGWRWAARSSRSPSSAYPGSAEQPWWRSRASTCRPCRESSCSRPSRSSSSTSP